MADSIASTKGRDESTPLLKQYWELKDQVPGAIMLFRMGDFYELFGDDAVEASKLLDLTLTSRDKNSANPLPMAGMPYHAATGYIQRLLECGKKVAIGEQVEDPEEARKRGYKSIVRREIVRVLTPAVQFEGDTASTGPSGPALFSTAIATASGTMWILAAIEPATGESFLSGELTEDQLFQEAQSLPIRHFLRVGHRLPERISEIFRARAETLFEDTPANRVAPDRAREILRDQFEIESLQAFVPENTCLDTATLAIGFLLEYLLRSQSVNRLPHLRSPKPLRSPTSLVLGPNTPDHLDLLPKSGRMSKASAFSLLEWMDRTKTAFGARSLRRALLAPLKDPRQIQERQSAVRELAAEHRLREKISEALTGFMDLDRLLGRVGTGLANPRDTRAIGTGLAKSGELLAALSDHVGGKPFSSLLLAEVKAQLTSFFPALGDFGTEILRIQRPEAPLHARDGGIFSRGYRPELDHLIDLTENGQRWLLDLEERERATTGINSLKVRYNRVFGYYIEVTTTHLKNVPSHYLRKQTTAGAERFFTEELKKFEDEMLSAEDKRRALETSLFNELVAALRDRTREISKLTETLAEIDVLTSLAVLANDIPGMTFPEIDDSDDLEIDGGRHPLVDAGDGKFVPNSIRMGHTSRTMLITGPNMGGKSTVMRQFALLILMGQMGAPIPAARARWGVVDAIYTRIGAQDAIASGQSTFMVEMTELAHILHHATARSFILLDEVGRGTSTYDGLSVAWGAIEAITRDVRARTLFATHYHELTELPSIEPAMRNLHVAVDASGDRLRFLYELRDGPASESFGIHVAALAGVPKTVTSRAREILARLERADHAVTAPLQAVSAGSLERAPSLPLHEVPSEIPTLIPTVVLPRFAAPTAAPSAGQMSLFVRSDEAAPTPANAPFVLPSDLASHLEAIDAIDVNSLTPVQALLALAEIKARQTALSDRVGMTGAGPGAKPRKRSREKSNTERSSGA